MTSNASTVSLWRISEESMKGGPTQSLFPIASDMVTRLKFCLRRNPRFSFLHLTRSQLKCCWKQFQPELPQQLIERQWPAVA